MESHKDVIVSQPPAMYSQSSYTQNISLENYKGILLCDRPTALSVGPTDVAGEGSKGFVSGGTAGAPLGLGPSAESRELRKQHEQLRAQNVRSQKNKSSQVLSRHRRWLRSFADQMKNMQQADVEREVAAAQRAARFRDAENQKRRDAAAALSVPQHAASAPPEPYNMQRELDPFKNTASKKKAKSGGGGGSKKPKWAMTEDEALDDELGLNDDLLDFAKQLDYDKFINDYAVAEALTVMRDRVAQIAAANDWTEDDIRRAAEPTAAEAAAADDDDLRSVTESEVASGAVRPAHRVAIKESAAQDVTGLRTGEGGVAHAQAWDASTNRGMLLKRAISQDALALAERMLTNSPSLQKIYTKQSLARVLQRCALTGDVNVTEASLAACAPGNNTKSNGGGGGATTKAALPAIPSTGTALQEPRVAHIAAEATTADGGQDPNYQGRVLRDMQNSKERTQGLPYLYRCPAI